MVSDEGSAKLAARRPFEAGCLSGQKVSSECDRRVYLKQSGPRVRRRRSDGERVATDAESAARATIGIPLCWIIAMEGSAGEIPCATIVVNTSSRCERSHERERGHQYIDQYSR